MAASDGLMTVLERNWAMVDAALEGLDETTLAWRPTAQCNSIAWNLWHMNRVLDSFVHTRLQEKPQIWVTEGWHQQYGMSDDAEERGVGWSMEQVAAWTPPGRDAQLGYYEAIKAATRAYVSSLSYEELEVTRVIPPVEEPRTVGAALGQVTWDNVSHGGQISFLRGLFLGAGWFSR